MKTFLTWTPVVVSVLILGLLTWQFVENKLAEKAEKGDDTVNEPK